MTGKGIRVIRFGLAVALLAGAILPILSLTEQVSALGTLTLRSLTLQAGASDGGSKPSGNVKHLFGFTTATTAAINSIDFQYCTTAGGTCTAPAGLNTSSATLSSQTGLTGFTFNTVSANEFYLGRSGAGSSGATAVTYQLSGIVNPNNTICFGGTTPQSNNCPFYVHITTYTSTNATTGATDDGTVAASIATQITLTGTMPESLIFCTGGTISNTGGVPDCSTATSGAISFNQLFSPADTATATSQMAASTNADHGYSITVNGVTLTSGSNTVTAMTTTPTGDAGVRGLSQFGLNLKANTTGTSTPAVGSEVAPAVNGTNYKGQSQTGYASVDHFRFVTGESVASSNNGGAGPSDIQTYTVSYIVNVNGAQAVGTYTTTLTYICTPTF